MSIFSKHNLFFLLLTTLTYAHAKDYTNTYIRERADIALKQCLDNNYVRLGAYNKQDLKDYSGWTYNLYKNQDYSLDGSNALTEFLEKNTSDFYMENLPLNSEVATPPLNAIFARCMDFYRSKKLKQFLIKTKP